MTNKNFKEVLSNPENYFGEFTGCPTYEDYNDEEEWYGFLVYDTRNNTGIFNLSHEYDVYKMLRGSRQNKAFEGKEKNKFQVSTKELLNRYIWIANCFRPQLLPNIFSHWSNSKSIDRAFKKEKSILNDDTYLALYWLMHFGMTEDDRYNDVAKLMANSDAPYIQDCLAFWEEPQWLIQNFHSTTHKWHGRFEHNRTFVQWCLREEDFINKLKNSSIYDIQRTLFTKEISA